MSNDLQTQQPAKPPIMMGDNGLALANFEDMWRFSQAVAASGLAPKGLERPEAILVAIQMGMEVGMKPMASIQNIAVINGRPSVWGDAALAVVQEHPKFEDIEEELVDAGTANERARCSVWKKGRDKPVVREFSKEQAKRAGLLNKQGPWMQYPERMLQMRARSWAIRDAFPGALKGLTVAEEAIDMPRRVVEGEVVEPAAPPAKGLAGIVASAKAKETASQEPAEDVYPPQGGVDTPEAHIATPEPPTAAESPVPAPKRQRKEKPEPAVEERKPDPEDIPPADDDIDSLFEGLGE